MRYSFPCRVLAGVLIGILFVTLTSCATVLPDGAPTGTIDATGTQAPTATVLPDGAPTGTIDATGTQAPTAESGTATDAETGEAPDISGNLAPQADGMWAHYVSPNSPTYLVSASGKPRNLLVIEVESLETTMFTKEQGGVWDYEVIPEMYQLLFDEDAIFFASDSGTRGTQDGYGSTWTTASLIANTSGVSFKVPPDMNNSYKAEEYLKGAYALGDVLGDFGYRNVLLSACRTSFGGVKEYFTYHGDYEIIDPRALTWTKTAGGTHSMTIPDSQANEWGFSDEFTFDVAKSFLSTEGDSDQPWHLFISTIDTHFTGYTYEAGDGYTGSETRFARKVENVYATTSRVIGEFVQWLRQQSFYEDTTVVIIGDHVNMLTSFCGEEDQAQRGRYNVILNSVVTTENTKDRSFTAFDFYPTMLAAAGFSVTGDRLALGTDLFSATQTLAEQYGLDWMNDELEHKADFYIDFIMGRTDWEDLVERSRSD